MSRHVACPTCLAPASSPCKGMVASGRFHAARTKAHQAAYVAPRRRKGGRRGKRTPNARTTSSVRLRPDEYAVLLESMQRLGLKTLAGFSKTEHGQRLIGRFERQREVPKACVVCGDHHYVLHHRTYKRLGAEWMTDVVPMCQKHHTAAHELLTARTVGVTLWNAHTHVKP